MAQQSAKSEQAKPQAKAQGEQVTYRPGPEGPVQVKWGGYIFHANVPRADIKDAELIERAKRNKFFHVGDFNPVTDAVPVKEDQPAPKTAEQYRAHAAAWIKTAQSVDELDTHWQNEETLRIACGVGTDDLEYIGTLFNPKRAELKKKDSPL